MIGGSCENTDLDSGVQGSGEEPMTVSTKLCGQLYIVDLWSTLWAAGHLEASLSRPTCALVAFRFQPSHPFPWAGFPKPHIVPGLSLSSNNHTVLQRSLLIWGFCAFVTQHLRECLAHSRVSVHMCLINEWLTRVVYNSKLNLSGSINETYR